MNKLLEYLNRWVQENNCDVNFYKAICDRLENLTDSEVLKVMLEISEIEK